MRSSRNRAGPKTGSPFGKVEKRKEPPLSYRYPRRNNGEDKMVITVMEGFRVGSAERNRRISQSEFSSHDRETNCNLNRSYRTERVCAEHYKFSRGTIFRSPFRRFERNRPEGRTTVRHRLAPPRKVLEPPKQHTVSDDDSERGEVSVAVEGLEFDRETASSNPGERRKEILSLRLSTRP